MNDPLLRADIYVPPTERQLSMNRSKHRSVIVSAMYRLFRLGNALFGRRWMARLTLDASRLFHRFAFELCSDMYGESFHNVSTALSQDILSRHIPAGGTVLDVGCGYGRACRMAAKFASSVVGVDHNDDLLDIAKKQSTEKNIDYVCGDLTKDIGDRRFDLVLLIHVIEHIDDPNQILQALRKISSRIIVEVPDFESDPLNLARFDKGLQFYSDGDHVREYTEKILTDQLTRNGWRIVEIRKNGGAVLAVAEAT